jgi:hypothetical protein
MVKSIHYLIALICLGSTHLAAQPADTTATKNQPEVYDFIFIGGRYQNKFTFMGRDFGQHIPFLTGNLTYYTHRNFWLTVSGFRFFNSTLPAQAGISLGYYTEFSEKTDFHISYTQFVIPPNAQVARVQSQGIFQSTFGLDWTYLYSTLQVQLLVNPAPDIFFTSQHSRYFEFNKLLFNKIRVSFEPRLSLTAGTSRFNNADEEVVIGPGGGIVTPPGRPPGSSGSGEKIRLLNLETSLPLNFQWGSFNLECFSRYTHPFNITEGDPSKPVFLGGAELTYHIPIKRNR